jgi:hypothetical protein
VFIGDTRIFQLEVSHRKEKLFIFTYHHRRVPAAGLGFAAYVPSVHQEQLALSSGRLVSLGHTV